MPTNQTTATASSPSADESKPSWYAITRKPEEDEVEIHIYDLIGSWGITADQFIRDLKSVTAKTVHVRINSGGGSVFDGIAMSSAIKRMKARVVTHVDGVAASIASIVAIAGHEVRMAKNGFLMIHNPMMAGGITADSGELRKMADTLDKMRGQIAQTYAARSNKSADEIAKLMDDETWFTSQEAKDVGFVDEITDEIPMAAAIDVGNFRNVPMVLKEQVATHPTPTNTITIDKSILLPAGTEVTQLNTTTAPDDSQRSEPTPVVSTQEAITMATDTIVAPAQAPAAENKTDTQVNLDPIRAQEIQGYVHQGREAGLKEGAKAERERCQKIVDVCPGKPKMALDAFIAGQSPDAVRMAFEATAAAEQAYEARIVQLQEDNRRAVALAATGGYPGGVGVSLDDSSDDSDEPMNAESAKAAATKEWDRNPAVRKGFSSKANYVSVRAAELQGKFRGIARATA